MSQESNDPRIGAYVDGELSGAEREEVENLISASGASRALAETFQWLDQVAGAEAVPQVSDKEWAALRGRVREASRAAPVEARGRVLRPAGGFTRRFRPALGVAAVVLVAAGLTLFMRSLENPGHPATPTPPKSAPAAVTAGRPASASQGSLEPADENVEDRVEPPEAQQDSFANKDLYAPTVETDDGDDHTSIHYGEDF